AKAGRNVWVPGIISDVSVNRLGGDLVHDCNSSGVCALPRGAPAGPMDHRCINEPLPVEGGVVEFDIYLPKSPAAILRGTGATVPDVPLYFEVMPHPSDPIGLLPNISTTASSEGDVTFIHVRIPLERSGSARIAAAWIYPSRDNWGLERRHLQVPSVVL